MRTQEQFTALLGQVEAMMSVTLTTIQQIDKGIGDDVEAALILHVCMTKLFSQECSPAARKAMAIVLTTSADCVDAGMLNDGFRHAASAFLIAHRRKI